MISPLGLSNLIVLHNWLERLEHKRIVSNNIWVLCMLVLAIYTNVFYDSYNWQSAQLSWRICVAVSQGNYVYVYIYLQIW